MFEWDAAKSDANLAKHGILWRHKACGVMRIGWRFHHRWPAAKNDGW